MAAIFGKFEVIDDIQKIKHMTAHFSVFPRAVTCDPDLHTADWNEKPNKTRRTSLQATGVDFDRIYNMGGKQLSRNKTERAPSWLFESREWGKWNRTGRVW